MKKSITVLFVLLFAVCGATIISCASTAKTFATIATSESDFEVTTEDGKVAITKYTGTATAVVIPAMIGGLPVVEIRWAAFEGCTGITSVSIPVGVTSIGFRAFEGCTGLTTVSIPASVTSIEDLAFSSCTALTAIQVDTNNTTYTSRNGVLFNKKGDTLVAYPAGKKERQYVIPASVTRIGDSAFEGCTDLNSVSIPTGVTSIGNYAFSDCTSLTSISIPASVTSIVENTFWGCTGLTAIQVDTNNTTYTSRNGVLFNKKGDTLVAYPAGKKERQYVIPAGVTSIGWAAFEGCTGLTSINIPVGVTSFEVYTFLGCTGLTSINIPASVTEIGPYSFSGCTGLTSVNIPAGVTSIGVGAFYGCTGLNPVTRAEIQRRFGDEPFNDPWSYVAQ